MTRFACGVGVLLLALGGATPGQEKDSPFDPVKLVGRWEPLERKKGDTSVVEFAAGGKVAFKVTVGGKTQSWDGTYAVTGQKLRIALKVGDKTVTEELVVLKLTDDELATEDAKGKKETLRRVQP